MEVGKQRPYFLDRGMSDLLTSTASDFSIGCAERRTENLGAFLSMSRKASTLVVRVVVGEGGGW